MNVDTAAAPAPSSPLSDTLAGAVAVPPRRPAGLARGARRVALAVLSLTLASLAPTLLPATAFAQATDDPQEMTVEELEAYIERQKAELEKVERNRRITAEKAREVEAALAAEAEKRRAVEEEVEALCQEREALEPGSYEACRALLDG